MPNIYTLTKDFAGLQAMLEDSEDLDQEAIENTLEGMSGDIDEMVDQSVKMIKNVESDAAGIDAEIGRLSARKRALENRVGSVRESIKALLTVAGKDKVKTPLFTVSIAKGRESVKFIDEAVIPDEFINVQTVIKPNKKLIGEAFKSGQPVAGCEWVRGEPSLRIK